MDNESDDLAPGQQPTRSAPSSGWNRPLLLAGVGLALMLGGYAAMNYVPSVALTARQAEQERQLTELRELAVKDQPSGTAMDRSFSDRLNQITPPWRSPPYQIPGRLALFGGLFLFVTAGVLMYRHAPPTPTNDDT